MGSSSVSCILWPNITMKLQAKLGAPLQSWLVEGSEIRCLAQVSFYKDRAQISLQVMDIDDQFTLGKMALQRQKTLQALRKRGLAQRNKNLQMPVLPLSIGLITAKDSRAESDFLHQLQDQKFPGKVFVAHASMQGKQTVEDIRKAYALLIAQGIDLVVLTRGGGSQADLRWFDSEEIAETICHSQVPFLVAIGHHDDVSIAEEVCHTHVKTPTAAAEAILSLVRDFHTHLQSSLKEIFLALEEASRRKSFALQEQVMQFQKSYERTVLRQMEKHRGRLLELSSAVNHSQQSIRRGLEQSQLRLESLAQAALVKKRSVLDRQTFNLNSSIDLCMQNFRYKTESLLQSLRVKDPSPWLSAGWTQIQTINGSVIKSTSQVNLDEFVTAQLGDGKLTMQIKKGNPT
jgi:exodeoxyribonuclease VII large subunit